MPYNTIAEAKEGKFPVAIDDIALTIGQINHLAKIYDDVKKENIPEPMAVAIATFKKVYKKIKDKWKRTETAMSEKKMVDVMNAVKKEFTEKLYRIDSKEIFKTGTWTDSKGNEYTFTEEDIEKIVKAFEKGVRSRDGVPLRFDTHGNKYDPAVGWVDKVWKKGKSLFVNIKGIPKSIKDLIDNKMYKRVSAGLIGDYKDPILKKTFRNVLDHVALLGAKAPAVKGLADWGKFYKDNGKIFVFSEGEEGIMQEDKEEKVMGDKLEQLNERLTSEVAEMKESKESLEKDFSETKEEKAALETKVKALEEKIEKEGKTAKENAVKSFLESEKVVERITPAMKSGFQEMLMTAEDFEAKKEEILKFPVIVDFSEKTGKGEKKEDKTEKDKIDLEEKLSQAEGKKVELDGYDLDEKARKLVEEEKVKSYEEAIYQIQREEK